MTDKLQCISPIDGSVLAERSPLDREEARQAAIRAREAQRAWAARDLSERIELVLGGVEELGRMNGDIVVELAWMMGRPIRYGDEFAGVRERAYHMAHIAADALADIDISDDETFKRYVRRVPHDVALVIAPWNYPYLTAINTIVPALIAGNSVLLKHASQTMLAGERLASAFHAAGVPREVFQDVVLDHGTTSGLIADGAFDFVNFTGSVAGGRTIAAAAANAFTGLGTELGGKDPGYVMDDADLDRAAETLMDAAMYNSGQCCCGIERIYVQETLYDAFVEKAVALVSAYRLGNPLDPATTIGPMASARTAKFVRSQIDEAVALGAVAHVPAFPEDDGSAYLTPQVLTGVSHAMSVMREESFGPVVGIMKVRSDDEALALMNDSEYGLTASLWTRDLVRAQAIGDRIETETVFMNRADYVDPALCWTGCKNTGRGGSLSVIGYHNLTRPKSFHLKKHAA